MGAARQWLGRYTFREFERHFGSSKFSMYLLLTTDVYGQFSHDAKRCPITFDAGNKVPAAWLFPYFFDVALKVYSKALKKDLGSMEFPPANVAFFFSGLISFEW